MATVDLVLRKKPNSQGKYPIAIRITKDRVPAYIYLGHYIDLDEWDDKAKRVKRTHPNSTRINNYINKKLSETTDNTLELEERKKRISSKQIKIKMKPTGGVSFAQQSDLYLQGLVAAGSYNEYMPNKTRLTRFKQFVGGDISFQDISVPLLKKFKVHIKVKYKLGARTIENYMSAIRSVYSFALEAEAITKEVYPFGKKGLKIKFPDSSKIGLDLDDIDRIEQVELTEKAHHARNLWLFSYYFAGMRVSDVLRLQWSDFQNGRLYYGMGKNDKFDSLKIPAEAEKILEEYRPDKQGKDDLVFPDLKGIDLSDDFNAERVIGFKTSAIDKHLRLRVAPRAGVSKKLTMHIARHTFAQLAGDEIPLPVLQRLYRHSDIATTVAYQSNFTKNDTDNALDKVLKKKEKKKLQFT